jgi:hypothetical protein
MPQKTNAQIFAWCSLSKPVHCASVLGGDDGCGQLAIARRVSPRPIDARRPCNVCPSKLSICDNYLPSID